MVIRHRVLIAAQPDARHLLETMLGEGLDLSPAHTIEDAFEILGRERIDLIVATVAFDESRMIEFLQMAKRSTSTSQIPFLCSRLLPGVLRDSMMASMRDACIQGGAVDFIDLARLPRDAAQEAIREAVAACLK
jgi:response regulator RpfG family c-di-GMP phosphodiesterase